MKRPKLTLRKAKTRPEESHIEPWTGRQDLLTRVTRYGLLTAIGAGVLALLLILFGFTGSTQKTPTQRTNDAADIRGQATASDFAQQFVIAWLEAKLGEESTLAPFVRTDGLRLPDEAAFTVSDARVASIEESRPARTSGSAPAADGAPVRDDRRIYTVTVSASVSDPRQTKPSERRYFSVPVVIADGGVRAASIPSPVPSPSIGADVSLGYRYRVGPSHPVTTAVQQFLAAVTSGEGEVSRYITPGTNLRALTPPPYSGVTVLDLASDRDFTGDAAASAPPEGMKTRVLATVGLAVSDRRSTTAQYALTLTARGGRWEVSALDTYPLLPAQKSAPAVGSSGTSPTSVATPTAAGTPAPAN